MTRFLFTFLADVSALWLAARARETRGGFLRKLIRRFRALHILEMLFLAIFAAKLCIHGGSKINTPAGAPAPPEYSLQLPDSSLFPVDSSLFPVDSSLFPVDSSLFPVDSSLFPVDSSLVLVHRELDKHPVLLRD